jgi:hypothetical protein
MPALALYCSHFTDLHSRHFGFIDGKKLKSIKIEYSPTGTLFITYFVKLRQFTDKLLLGQTHEHVALSPVLLTKEEILCVILHSTINKEWLTNFESRI